MKGWKQFNKVQLVSYMGLLLWRASTAVTAAEKSMAKATAFSRP